jgi:hypothetical protein
MNAPTFIVCDRPFAYAFGGEAIETAEMNL